MTGVWCCLAVLHDDVIKWKYFPRYWPLRGEFTGHRWIPRTKASDAELWCFLWSVPWINGWGNNHEAGDLRHQCTHYDVIVMVWLSVKITVSLRKCITSHLRGKQQACKPISQSGATSGNSRYIIYRIGTFPDWILLFVLFVDRTDTSNHNKLITMVHWLSLCGSPRYLYLQVFLLPHMGNHLLVTV